MTEENNKDNRNFDNSESTVPSSFITQNDVERMSKEDIENELIMLKNSWDMYERTKEQTIKRRSTATDRSGNKVYSDKSTQKTMELLETMQDDIVKKYLMLGGTIDELKKKPVKKGRKKSNASLGREKLEKIIEMEKKRIAAGKPDDVGDEEQEDMILPETESQHEDPYQYFDYVDEKQEEHALPELKKPDTLNEEKPEPVNIETRPESSFTSARNIGSANIDITRAKGNTIKYDVIPLPSNGECYKSKIGKVPVSYLTAYDENMIIAPNMYKDGSFLDHILSQKIMTDEIDPMDMLTGDRDAIVLWLRASGYGNEFPVEVSDPETNKQFKTVIDLTQLKYKPFKLKGDQNGHFDFTLPFSKHQVKFRFLTYRDLKELEKMEEDEVSAIKVMRLNEMADNIDEVSSESDEMPVESKKKLKNASEAIREYAKTIKENTDENLYSHSVTNRLCRSIVSVNGVTERKYIEEYVSFMNVRDSSALRKYISENEPGIDFNIEVERPESLGGGSVRMFLTIDQFIFLQFT